MPGDAAVRDADGDGRVRPEPRRSTFSRCDDAREAAAGNYDDTQTWTAKDACGNQSNPVSQTIHVVDTHGAGDRDAAGADAQRSSARRRPSSRRRRRRDALRPEPDD